MVSPGQTCDSPAHDWRFWKSGSSNAICRGRQDAHKSHHIRTQRTLCGAWPHKARGKRRATRASPNKHPDGTHGACAVGGPVGTATTAPLGHEGQCSGTRFGSLTQFAPAVRGRVLLLQGWGCLT